MVNTIYRGLGRSVGQIFGPDGMKTAQLVAELTDRKHAQTSATPQGGDGAGGRSGESSGGRAEPPAIPLLRSKESFKVLTECPLIVMLLFQLYPKYIKANIPDLIPLMIEALRLAPQLSRDGEGVLPAYLRGRYKELIACQVTTASKFCATMLDVPLDYPAECCSFSMMVRAMHLPVCQQAGL